MQGQEILEALVRDHATLRTQLLDWEAALAQASGHTYGHCQHAVSVLRELSNVVAHELQHHFREEETVLYPVAELRLPRLRPLLSELRGEHDACRQTFEDFRRDLQRFNATGELQQLPHRGRDLIRLLRSHLEREERELHPVVHSEFTEKDWFELRRVYVDSEVA